MLIKNCKIVSSKGIKEGDILVEGEKIVSVGKNLGSAEKIIDAKGSYVMPGVVDAHVHVRDFEESYKEDFTSASSAALAGGVTTILEMPNTNPPICDKNVLSRRIEIGEKKSLVDFGIHPAFSDTLNELNNLDIPSLKVYMDSLGDDMEDIVNRALHSSKLLTVHCEDPRIIKRNTRFGRTNQKDDFLLHSDIREKKAETSAVELVAKKAKKNRQMIHICHISLPKSVKLLNEFTTCEVTPHHLLLTEKELRDLKGIAKTNPPLRPKLDVHGLWKAVKEGKIDVIASDHAPHTLQEKKGDVFTAPSGVPNLEIMLPLLLDVVNRGALGLPDLVRMMCENPSKIFRVKGKGRITPGADADILILDMETTHKIDPAKFHSKAKYSPFSGRKIKGQVQTVLQRGNLVYSEGELQVKSGGGRYLYRQV